MPPNANFLADYITLFFGKGCIMIIFDKIFLVKQRNSIFEHQKNILRKSDSVA